MASTKPTVLLDHSLRQLTLTTMLWEYPSIAAQMPTQDWYGTIGDLTIADAILDRTVHNAHTLVLKGDSMRKMEGLHNPE